MKKACTVGTNFSDFTIVNKDSDVGIRTTGNFGLDLRNSSISMIPGSLHIGSNALDRNSSEPRLGGSHFNEQIVLGFYFVFISPALSYRRTSRDWRVCMAWARPISGVLGLLSELGSGGGSGGLGGLEV